jgi:hypothetical protein
MRCFAALMIWRIPILSYKPVVSCVGVWRLNEVRLFDIGLFLIVAFWGAFLVAILIT